MPLPRTDIHREELLAEWHELDARVAELAPARSRQDRPRLILAIRREEAGAAVRRWLGGPPRLESEWRHAVEKALLVLREALDRVEGVPSEPRFEVTAACGGRPLPLVARSLRRRQSL